MVPDDQHPEDSAVAEVRAVEPVPPTGDASRHLPQQHS